MTPLGRAALALAAKGLRVFPCIERDKRPLINNNLKRATTDPNVIAGWWSARNYNIGIATGPGSSIWVLDLDGEDDEAWLRRLEAQHGSLPPTVEAITSKGRHLYFRWPTGVNIRNIQDREDFPDVRGDGGYVMAPPSVHPSGRRYAWSVDSAYAFDDAPDWLVELVVKREASEAKAHTPESWRTFIGERVDGSHRGHAVARLCGLLLRRYVDPYVSLDLCRMFNTLRCDPPLPDDQVIEIVNAICGRERQRDAARGR
jgi:hypothetical protein